VGGRSFEKNGEFVLDSVLFAFFFFEPPNQAMHVPDPPRPHKPAECIGRGTVRSGINSPLRGLEEPMVLTESNRAWAFANNVG